MENLKNYLGKGKMLSILLGVVFICSCQKDQSSIDEYRYRRGINWRRPTQPVDSTSSSGATTDSTQNQPNSTGTNTGTLPKVSAGDNVSVAVGSVTLDGSQSTGGTSYLWTKEAGPSATIAAANSLKTNVTGLVNGEYRFRLTAKNSVGTASDTVHVSVILSTTTSGGTTGTGGSGTTSGTTGSTATSTRQNILWSADAEGTTWANPFYELSSASCCSYSIVQDNSFKAVGQSSIKFSLYKSDPLVGLGARSELTPTFVESNPSVERWVGFSVYLPSATWGIDVAPELIHQSHAQNGESPPFGIRTWNGRYYITVNYDSSGKVINKDYDTGIPYKTDTWNKIVYHIKYANNNTGFIYVWVNGTLIFQYVNRITQYAGLSKGNFYRFGIYKNAWSDGWKSNVSTRVFYEDEMRIGSEKATYNDVVPGN
jgi:hypothetical protein